MDPSYALQTKSPSIYGIATAFIAVSTIVVGLRLYTRFKILGVIGSDDTTIAFAQVLSIVVAILTCLEAKTGLGRHVQTVSASESEVQLRYFFAAVVIYNVAMNVVKFSLLLQYRRIFAGNSKWMSRVCAGFMIYVGLWMIVQVTILALACVPIAVVLPHMADKCLDTLPIWYFSSGMNIFTDFTILLIPLPSVLKLKLRRKQKILLLGVFGLGFFTCIVSIVRIFTLRVALYTNDPTWDNTGAANWSVVELNCAVLCSSIPTLRPFLAKVVPGWLSSSSGNGGATSGGVVGNRYEMYGSRGGRASSRVAQSKNATLVGDVEADGGDIGMAATGRARKEKGGALGLGRIDSSDDESATGKCADSSAASTEGLRENAATSGAAPFPGGAVPDGTSFLILGGGKDGGKGAAQAVGLHHNNSLHHSAHRGPAVYASCEADRAQGNNEDVELGTIRVTTEMKVRAEGRGMAK